MTFEITKPILIVGIGGVGSKLAIEAKKSLNSDCILISHDQKDFEPGITSIEVSTGPTVNPSIYLIRGYAFQLSKEIANHFSKYSTIVLMANLAGKAGAAFPQLYLRFVKKMIKI